jgi:hypothetical protein
MPRSVDFKRLNLSHSEQAMIKKGSRVMVALYASMAVIALIPRSQRALPRGLHRRYGTERGAVP